MPTAPSFAAIRSATERAKLRLATTARDMADTERRVASTMREVAAESRYPGRVLRAQRIAEVADEAADAADRKADDLVILYEQEQSGHRDTAADRSPD
jgi:hypothetical protein